MNAEQAVMYVLTFVTTWAKRFAGLGLLLFILLTIAKLFGFPTYLSIPTLGWQEFGVFVAGTAYALGGR